MILANWRGFSGGQRDMYNEVLKYGSYIVDPTINPEFMEMYADEDARGGVLEPEGIVNIKYRRDKQLETMARLDPEYGALRKQLADKSLTPDQISDVKVKATAREQLLLQFTCKSHCNSPISTTV